MTHVAVSVLFEKLKHFEVMLNNFESSRVQEIVES